MMIRWLLPAALLLGCAACADADSDRPWYDAGDVTYDKLKAAADACKAKGGDFRLKTNGDPKSLEDYQCAPSKGS